MLKLRKGKGAKSIFFTTKEASPISKDLKVAFLFAIGLHLMGLLVFTIVRPNFFWRTQPKSMVLLIEDSDPADARGEIASEKGRLNSLQTLLDFEWEKEQEELSTLSHLQVRHEDDLIPFLEALYLKAISDFPVSKIVKRPISMVVSGPDAEEIDLTSVWKKLDGLFQSKENITIDALIDTETSKMIWLSFYGGNASLHKKVKEILLSERFAIQRFDKDLLSIRLHISND